MPRPRFAKLSAEKRSRILEVAAAEFAENGLGSASYNRIIEQAGLSKGAMYYYFDDKLDLYITVLEDALAHFVSMAPHPLPDTGQQLWAQYEDWWKKSIRFAQSHPELAALIRGLMRDAVDLRSEPRVRALYEQAEQMIEAVLCDGQARGLVRTDLPMSLLLSTTFAMGQAADRWVFEHLDELKDEDLDLWARSMIGLFRRMVEPEEKDNS